MAISSVGSTITGAGATSVSGVIKSISFGGSSTSAIDVTSISATFKTYVMGMEQLLFRALQKTVHQDQICQPQD
jgi:hypothetical protein